MIIGARRGSCPGDRSGYQPCSVLGTNVAYGVGCIVCISEKSCRGATPLMYPMSNPVIQASVYSSRTIQEISEGIITSTSCIYSSQ